MSGPCMCGADDCPACRPGCRDWLECSRCGNEFRRDELTNGLCDACERVVQARQEAEDREAEEAEERRRENLADEQNGNGAA